MRTLCKSVMAFGLVGLMALPVMAQGQQRRGGPGGPGGPGGGFGRAATMSMLLSNKSVQDELKLDDAQKAKVDELTAKAREKFTAARESLANLDQAERAKKFQEMTKEAENEARKAVGEILKPEQTKRLREITIQTSGAAAFEQERLQKALKLTDEQKTEIDSIIKTSNEELRGLFQGGGDRQAAFAKVREHRKATLDKVQAKLTDEQKAEYAKLIGAPFEVKFEGGPGGGGPRGGR